MNTRLIRLAGLVLCASLAGAPAVADMHGEAESNSGIYRVGYTSRVAEPALNVMHEWILTVRTEAGDPVENAEITVDGGMPAHNHGLPTAPRVTEYLGDGQYRVRGFRFHMRGDWQVSFEIRESDRSDTVTFDLTL